MLKFLNIGGKNDYPKSSNYEIASVDPRMFIGSNDTGVFKYEELSNFSQIDLPENDVALLDTFYEIFLWIGPGANDKERKHVIETAESYLKSSDDGRNIDECPITTVYSGQEPVTFAQYFKAWDWGLSEFQEFVDPYEKMKAKYRKDHGIKVEEKPQLKSYITKYLHSLYILYIFFIYSLYILYILYIFFI